MGLMEIRKFYITYGYPPLHNVCILSVPSSGTGRVFTGIIPVRRE